MSTSLQNLDILIITHIVFRNNLPIAGPYSTVIKSFQNKVKHLEILEIPLYNFEEPIIHGDPLNLNKLKIDKLFSVVPQIKYIIDIIITTIFLFKFILRKSKYKTVISIDPLSAIIPSILCKLFRIKSIFYCVDFNENRFGNKILQKLYERADKISSIHSDQTWSVCVSMKKYKLENYGSNSLYIPNSFSYVGDYAERMAKRSGNRVVWTGSILTDKQIVDLYDICLHIQKLRPETEFWFIPSNRLIDFEIAARKSTLKKIQIFNVYGQEKSRDLVSQCDLGLAVYDKNFGSTKYIEPIKIWEYMLCGIPFIISKEPSVNPKIIKSGVAFILDEDNKVKDTKRLKKFIDKSNLSKLYKISLSIAKEYDAEKLMEKAILNLF